MAALSVHWDSCAHDSTVVRGQQVGREASGIIAITLPQEEFGTGVLHALFTFTPSRDSGQALIFSHLETFV